MASSLPQNIGIDRPAEYIDKADEKGVKNSASSHPIFTSSATAVAIRETCSKAWPPSKCGTITMSDVYRVPANDQGTEPAKLFAKVERFMATIENASSNVSLTVSTSDTISRQLQDAMARVVYGGNLIEKVGLGQDDTLKICRYIFAGEDVENVNESTPELLEKLVAFHDYPTSDLRTMPVESFLRGRREVIQHAKAMHLMIHWVAISDIPFSEQLVKDAHRALCEGTPILAEEGTDNIETPWEKYAGKYRTVHVGAGSTMFTPPQFVGKQMRELVHDLNTELEAALTQGTQGTLDPFAFAAKYSMKFVQIHPFQDGNGRICRMILNAIFCKFAGIVVPIGETKEDRDEYIRIK